MTTETRKLLEERLGLTSAGKQSSVPAKKNEVPEEAADAYSEAPKSYKKEFAELFKALSPEFRKYLCERESETEKGFSRLNNELNALRWVEEYFNPRRRQMALRGFRQPRDYFEGLARLDEAFERDPERVLKVLEACCKGKVSEPAAGDEMSSRWEACFRKVEDLGRRLDEVCRCLDERGEPDIGKMITDYLRSKSGETEKAKRAAFSPKGKLSAGVDLSKLTTRELLELQMRDMD